MCSACAQHIGDPEAWLQMCRQQETCSSIAAASRDVPIYREGIWKIWQKMYDGSGCGRCSEGNMPAWGGEAAVCVRHLAFLHLFHRLSLVFPYLLNRILGGHRHVRDAEDASGSHERHHLPANMSEMSCQLLSLYHCIIVTSCHGSPVPAETSLRAAIALLNIPAHPPCPRIRLYWTVGMGRSGNPQYVPHTQNTRCNHS